MSEATATVTAKSPALAGRTSYWRSLDELQSTDAFQEFLAREFPQAASEFPEGVSRRRWMQLMSASFALAGAAGCRWQTEKIAPFAERPEGYIPGTHQHYATNVHWAGAPRHLLVTKYDERPIKIEGNPDHPASRGGSDSFSQAMTLALYDPDRSTRLRRRDGGKSFTKQWSDFDAFLAERVKALGDGSGLAILAEPVGSHSRNLAMEQVAAKLPGVKFYQHAPLSDATAVAGAKLAFGEPLRTHYRLAKARVIAAFDADLLTGMPDSLRMARDFAEARDPDHSTLRVSGEDGEEGVVMNRLWAVESQFTSTGATADHRLPMKSSAIGGYLAQLRDAVKASLAADTHDHDDEKIEVQPTPEQFLECLADDLVHHPGECVVAVGPTQPAEVHAIAHEINVALGAVGETVLLTEAPKPTVETGSIEDLVAAIGSGGVDTLIVVGGNPAYDAPANSGFAEAIKEVPHAVRLGVYDDETARLCEWSLPETHPLEEWGDVIGWDGSIGVCQPMIEPLVGGRSALELMGLLAGDPAPNARQMVADAVSAQADGMGEPEWNKAVHDGVLEGSGYDAIAVSLAKEGFEAPAAADGLEVVFTPSTATYDGRLANSGWLQETPDFLTKLTWDNAALVAPATAKELGLEHGKVADLTVGNVSLKAPVYVMPGQAKGSIGVALGYGRTAAGRVGGLLDPETGEAEAGLYANGIAGLWVPAPAEPVGFDAYPLRPTATTGYVAEGVEIAGTSETYLLASVQDHHAIDQMGLEAIGRRTGELIREGSAERYEKDSKFAPHMAHDVMVHSGGEHRPTEPLWNLREYNGDYAWGMSIDLTKCIGCNACMVACQAENNVPVVGKDQVARGREMHWIRIDRYFKGTANPDDPADPANFDNPEVAHQPIACQQCETAPCEQVCPVAATVHDDEGLNGMAYNRCIGTRYCANNCPYKVRRFNYFRYTKPLYDTANNELMQLVTNPEVTVRSRGVMEKCTYCTQRISAARITAKNEGRTVRDGDVVTACQQACSTRAIEFGDLRDEQSRVRAAHDSDRSYGILTELMTNPR
ncbi:MAG: TAT-variant-translocated molybdopterin oxidoreductase, partial [Planctomycetota bacterium]